MMTFYSTDDLRNDEIFLRLEHTCDAQPEKRWLPAYYFNICLLDGTKVGHCDLRIGHNDKTYIGGNIGYGIDAAYRGHHYATKACELLFRQARKHQMDHIIITCDPANLASARTCELAGGQYLETVPIPEDNEMFAEGKRQVMIWRFELTQREPCHEGNLINNENTVKAQYATSVNLSKRISIHAKYSTNKQGFGNWIMEHYPTTAGMSVLELGCGTGDIWLNQKDYIERCSRIILTDFSEGMLLKAKKTLKQHPQIDYAVVDIQNIPFADQSFDFVIANMMLYHIPNISRGLSEVRRVLRRGGIFCCATYGENGIMEYLTRLFGEYGVKEEANHTFTLQNGEEQLRTYFDTVERHNYEDLLEVTDVNDLADYIFSLTGMSSLRALPREIIIKVLSKASTNGVLKVPKDYGLFLSH